MKFKIKFISWTTVACGMRKLITSSLLNFLLLFRKKINTLDFRFTLDFELNGPINSIRVARKVGCKTSKLVEEKKLNGVGVGDRVNPKDGKKMALKRNI